jgi:hypothetical protein
MEMKKKDWLAGLGLLVACAVCCAIPLIGSAAALGISSFLFDPLIAAGMTLTLAIVGVMVYRRRLAGGSACKKTGCGCSSCTR